MTAMRMLVRSAAGCPFYPDGLPAALPMGARNSSYTTLYVTFLSPFFGLKEPVHPEDETRGSGNEDDPPDYHQHVISTHDEPVHNAPSAPQTRRGAKRPHGVAASARPLRGRALDVIQDRWIRLACSRV